MMILTKSVCKQSIEKHEITASSCPPFSSENTIFRLCSPSGFLMRKVNKVYMYILDISIELKFSVCSDILLCGISRPIQPRRILF